MIDTESGPQVRLARRRPRRLCGRADSVIHRRGCSRRIDVDAEVSGRSLGAVARRGQERASRKVAFPFEYHAEVLGEHVERKAALASLYSYLVAAAIVIVLLLQAAWEAGVWRASSSSACRWQCSADCSLHISRAVRFRWARSSDSSRFWGSPCAMGSC